MIELLNWVFDHYGWYIDYAKWRWSWECPKCGFSDYPDDGVMGLYIIIQKNKKIPFNPRELKNKYIIKTQCATLIGVEEEGYIEFKDGSMKAKERYKGYTIYPQYSGGGWVGGDAPGYACAWKETHLCPHCLIEFTFSNSSY